MACRRLPAKPAGAPRQAAPGAAPRPLSTDELALVTGGARRRCDCGACAYCVVYDRNR